MDGCFLPWLWTVSLYLMKRFIFLLTWDDLDLGNFRPPLWPQCTYGRPNWCSSTLVTQAHQYWRSISLMSGLTRTTLPSWWSGSVISGELSTLFSDCHLIDWIIEPLVYNLISTLTCMSKGIALCLSILGGGHFFNGRRSFYKVSDQIYCSRQMVIKCTMCILYSSYKAIPLPILHHTSHEWYIFWSVIIHGIICCQWQKVAAGAAKPWAWLAIIIAEKWVLVISAYVLCHSDGISAPGFHNLWAQGPLRVGLAMSVFLPSSPVNHAASNYWIANSRLSCWVAARSCRSGKQRWCIIPSPHLADICLCMACHGAQCHAWPLCMVFTVIASTVCSFTLSELSP